MTHPLFFNKKLSPPTEYSSIEETQTVIISQRWDHNYRHFLIETLPLIGKAKEFLRKNSGSKAVIFKKLPEYVTYILECNGIGEKYGNLILQDMDSIVLYRNAYVMNNIPMTSENVSESIAQVIQKSCERFPKNTNHRTKIFLDRKILDNEVTSDEHFHSRRIVNKSILYEIIDKYDYTYLEPGTVSFAEQVAIIHYD